MGSLSRIVGPYPFDDGNFQRELFKRHLLEVYDPEAFVHPLRVAAHAKTDDEYVVALCHDALEDSVIPVEDLVLLLTQTQFDAVTLLTRQKENETYAQYIQALCLNVGDPAGRLAATVKMYDLFDHLDPIRVNNLDQSKIDRYVKAIRSISYALAGEPE